MAAMEIGKLKVKDVLNADQDMIVLSLKKSNEVEINQKRSEFRFHMITRGTSQAISDPE